MRNGNDAAEHARKRKQTAQAAIDTHKRMTAGLHFAVGNTHLHLSREIHHFSKFHLRRSVNDGVLDMN